MNEQEPVLNIYVFYISQIYSNQLQTFSTIVTASASGFFLFAPKKHVAIDLKKTGFIIFQCYHKKYDQYPNLVPRVLSPLTATTQRPWGSWRR